MKTYRITCRGRVQGVFFRKYTVEAAKRIGIHGWVKNEKNGDVSIIATGESESIKALIEWCYQGSPMSNVVEVKSEEVKLQEFSEFSVEY